MGKNKPVITATDVEAYLIRNPDFFVGNPLALESLELNMSPEGTVSLAQKQQQHLHNKNRQLNEQLQILIETAHNNMELLNKVHQLCLQLMDARNLKALLVTLNEQIRSQFSADEVALRLFYCPEYPLELSAKIDNVKLMHADGSSLKEFDKLLGKQKPICGRLTLKQKTFLFAKRAKMIKSVACLPLGHEPCAGLLAIGSQDPNRFHADMVTDYLEHLGEVFMRCLRKNAATKHDN